MMSDEIEYKFVRGQGWVAQYKPVEAPVTEWTVIAVPQTYRYFIDDYWSSELTQYYQNFPQVQRAPREPQAPSRYFPGSNTRAESVEVEETIHERRAREYREAVRRFER